MKPEIEYLPDDSIDDAMDRELRGLLTTCFTKPEDVVFRERRYFVVPYQHRWVIRDSEGAVVAHIGVHDKEMHAGDAVSRFGGICEVCVHPDHRGKGYVRMILEQIHQWLADHDFAFSILFGDPLVYGSSGYVKASNLFVEGGDAGWTPAKGLICALGSAPWPTCDVHLAGKKF